jgi:hypothetical protein
MNRDERMREARRVLGEVDQLLAGRQPILKRIVEARVLFVRLRAEDFPNGGSREIFKELARSSLAVPTAPAGDDEIAWMRDQIARALRLAEVWG